MRTWLVNLIKTDPLIAADVDDRVWARNSRNTSVLTKPYIIYSLGVSSTMGLHDEEDAEQQYLQIWIHDEPGDYSRIDRIADNLKVRLVGAGSAPDRVMTILWLETSQEFDDETMETFYRYVRFRAIRS